MNRPTPTLKPLTSRQATRIVKRAKIDGDSFIVHDHPYNLSAKYLLKIGFLPTYQAQLNHLTFAFSPAYSVGTYLAIMTFVQNEHRTQAYSYYRHPIYGVWCFLPEYFTTHSPTNAPIERLGTGYRLESVILPTFLQQILQQIALSPTLELDQSHAYFCFAGTAKRFRNREQLLERLRSGQVASTYYQTIASKPSLRLLPPSDTATPPTELIPPEALAPNFSTLQLNTYQITTPFCPSAQIDTCYSQNHQLEYSFCRPVDNSESPRAWLSHLQTTGKLTPLGLQRHWAIAGDFNTPLYTTNPRYAPYFSPKDHQSSGYHGLWSKYLQKAPFLQAYLTAIQS